MPPAADNAAAYENAMNGDMRAQSTPTITLEAKSPIPFTVWSTPKPVPLTSVGNRLAAVVPSSVSVMRARSNPFYSQKSN